MKQCITKCRELRYFFYICIHETHLSGNRYFAGPLAIGTGAGSETWQPMGIAVIGGLTFSTILTLFIVPVLYSILVNRSQRKEREKLARLSAEHQASKH